MNKTKFWNLIEAAGKESDGDVKEQAKVLVGKLGKLTPEEITQFHGMLQEQMALACRWDLRGAAHLINGGCSDDGFEAFRGWLIAQGRAVFEEALDDPESLADVADADVGCPEILRAAEQAYKVKTGKPMPPHPPLEVEPSGEEWIEDDLQEMFPRLWAEFGEES